MNGVSLLGATHLVAVRALRNNPMKVSLLVCDGYDPKEVVRRKMEAERQSVSNASISIETSSLSSEGKSMKSAYILCIYIQCHYVVYVYMYMYVHCI